MAMQGQVKSLVYFTLGILTGILLISQMAFKEKNDKKEIKFRSDVSEFELPKVPDTMSFAGEQVPLNRWEVREAFDRELIYNHGFPAHISYILKLSRRFFPDIEARLKEKGVPEDFKYLC